MDIVNLFTHMDLPVWDKVLRTVTVYLAILVLIRVAGRRLMAQMNSLDLVVVLLLSNVVQNAIIGPDYSLLGGLIGATVLVVGNTILDRFYFTFPRFGRAMEGRPVELIRHGKFDKRAMRAVGVTPYEMAVELGRQGAVEVDQIATASLTPGGSLMMDFEPGDRPITRDELNAAVATIMAKLDGMSAGAAPKV